MADLFQNAALWTKYGTATPATADDEGRIAEAFDGNAPGAKGVTLEDGSYTSDDMIEPVAYAVVYDEADLGLNLYLGIVERGDGQFMGGLGPVPVFLDGNVPTNDNDIGSFGIGVLDNNLQHLYFTATGWGSTPAAPFNGVLVMRAYVPSTPPSDECFWTDLRGVIEDCGDTPVPPDVIDAVGAIDPEWAPSYFNSRTDYVLPLSNNNIAVSGNFSTAAGVPARGIALFDTYGNFIAGASGGTAARQSYRMLEQASRFYVAGFIDGISSPFLRAFDIEDMSPFGALSATFQNVVYSVMKAPVGEDLLVAGAFTSINSTAMTGVGSITPLGVLSSGFVDRTMTAWPREHVNCMAVLTNGTILYVSSSMGQLRALKPDGTVDSSFPTDLGGVAVVASQYGGFYLLNGIDMARYTNSGAIDSSFSMASLSAEIRDVCEYPAAEGSGRLLVAFAAAPGAIRLHSDGTVDSTFSSQHNGGARCVKLQPDGKVLLAGTSSVVRLI